ncbi:heparinase II/III family protein [Ancylobacter terrae]|uniref:heparinase II/III family protein n=1 Tax=Ancylobacter sp. sgz301288 TaxID=3342077 RepID=UPI00385CD0AA
MGFNFRGNPADRLRLGVFVVGAGWRKLRSRVLAQRWLPLGSGSVPVSTRLLIAPQDLRTGDATRATEIYAGRFAFAGKVVSAEGRSPFEIEPPSVEWSEALLSFGWLRHMRAAGSTIARANARALVSDWIALSQRRDPAGWDIEVVARRVISWLTQSPLILQDADQAFNRRFMRSLAVQTRYLKRAGPIGRDGYPRLVATIALAFAALCMAEQGRLLRTAQRRLCDELDRQVLPDGGHIGRNPGLLIELLLDLLPLRQAFNARNLPPPPALLNAIDRIMPMLRFFRHGDGAFAQFNGMGPTPADSLATVLAYDDTRGAPVANAPHSGYQRLEAGGTVVIADTGPAPPLGLSGETHAGCLAFELSSGRSRIVVNCGMPATGREAWRPAARQTAAHSTVVIEDTSSCRFLAEGTLMRLCGAPILEGPAEVPVERLVREEAQFLRASHDGYARRFGVLHARSWRLSPDGDRLDGEDVLRAANTRKAARHTADEWVARFHLYPGVVPTLLPEAEAVQLTLPSGETWLFTAPGHEVDIEESVFLAATGGPRRTDQIVVSGDGRAVPRVVWTFLRVAPAPAAEPRPRR